MSAEMSFQTAVGGKIGVADDTFVCFETSMSLHMSFQHSTWYKVPLTLSAMVRLLTWLETHTRKILMKHEQRRSQQQNASTYSF